MEVKWLTIKSGIWAVKEVPAEQFEQAKLTFLQKAGVKVQIVPEPLADSPPMTPASTNPPPATPSAIIAQAINGARQGEGFPY